MKTKISFFLLFFLLGNFVFAKSAPVPLWVTDIDSVYDTKKYIAQLGTGDSEDLAKIDALKSISSYLQTKVQSEGISTRVATSGDSTSYSVSAIQKVTVQTSAELFAVEYETYYYKKTKKYYSVAFIEKSKYWTQIQPRIENKKHSFIKFYEEAEKMFMSSEPILARKYFMLAQSSGDDFVDAVSMARLIVGDIANVYSKDEKKVFEIAKNIKDTEKSIAIFMEIQGDFSNTVESKVKSLFESEKYSFTNNRKNCSHVMSIEIDQNKIVTDRGTDDEITSVAPSITLTLINPYERQNLFSFTRKAEKGIAYTQDVALQRGYENLCKKLESDLMESFQEKMLED